MNGTVYMRISPSKRFYIGQTVKSEERRWKQHVASAFNENSSEYKTPLSASIRKYGGDAFNVVILESGIETQDELNEREMYWIKEKHALINEGLGGLNVTIGGYGYRKFLTEDFQNLYNKGYSICKIAKITGANPGTVSQHLADTDTRENHRRARRETLERNPPKSVSNYDVETCKKIMTFRTAADAALYYCGKRDAAYITNAINGAAASAFGYLWKYDEQPMSVVYEHYERYHNPNNRNTRGLPVVNVETGEVYVSALQAAKQTGIKRDLIVSCCKGWRENAGGYHWRYEGEEQSVYKGKHAKPIICKTTGEVYPSVSEAARQTSIPINKITDCLKCRREDANGFHFEYKNPEDKKSGIFKNSRFKPIICIDTGVVYETMLAACKAAGVDYHTLHKHLINGIAIFNGQCWKYYNKQEGDANAG